MNDTVMGDTITDRVPNMAGQALRAARENAGLTAEDVASKLKLSARQILAIEAEDWGNLPERTFTRGFFYSYARLVNVEKSVIDQSFSRRAAALDEMRTLPEGIGEVTAENTSTRSAYSKWFIPAALLAALIAGIAWFVYKEVPFPKAPSRLPLEAPAKSPAAPNNANQGTPSSAATAPVDASAANAAATAPSSNPSQPSPASPTETGTSSQISLLTSSTLTSTSPPSNQGAAAAATSTPASSSSVQTTSPTVASVAPAAATAAPATAPARALAKGERRVVIEASGRSWSEARAAGDVVLSEMLNGNSREFIAKGPISFVIGNSSNVKLTIDGKPYDFSPHVRNEVARFRVE